MNLHHIKYSLSTANVLGRRLDSDGKSMNKMNEYIEYMMDIGQIAFRLSVRPRSALQLAQGHVADVRPS